MSSAVSLAELLTQLAGVELSFQREEEDVLVVAFLALPSGRQMLVIQRTYRDGIKLVLDPTPEEVEIARSGDLWRIWNSERGMYLAGAV
jgi:hypothetical protein